MVAITRFCQYPLSAAGVAGDGRNAGGVGTAGYSISTASVGDSFTIGPTTNRLHVSIDGDPGSYITLYSGSSLDPRFVARDITEKMHALGKADERWDNAVCKWKNHSAYGNRFEIYSGTLGSASTVVVVSGSNTAHAVLGWSTKSEAGGTVNNSTGAPNTFNGDITISGTYYGFLDETYKIVITNDNDAVRGIGTPTNKTLTYVGTMTTGGVYNSTADTTYTITFNVTNGTTMGQGTGNVPTITWTAAASADNSSADTELLYPENWYSIGTRGLMVKFTDAVFGNGTWDIPCYKPDYTSGSNVTDLPGTAYFAYSSDRGDMGAAAVTAASGTYTSLGSRGLNIAFTPTGSGTVLGIRDEFSVICSAPAPTSYNITSLNYGNVTVSTESDVKCVMFEIESGAAQMSTVKFGLQNNGSFSHHVTGNADTYFRFGTVGPENVAGTGGTNAIEWYPDVVAADIDSDTPPSYLYATEDNLAVVSTADASEAMGNWGTGLVSDPMWVNIRLGSSETGANSTINYRLYFDYS